MSSRRLIYIIAFALLANNLIACKSEKKSARRSDQVKVEKTNNTAGENNTTGETAGTTQGEGNDTDVSAESDELQDIAITVGRIGNAESEDQTLEEIRVEAQRIKESQNQTPNQEQELEEIAVTAERIAEQELPQLEEVVVSAERIVISDVVTKAIAQATGGAIKVDLDKMTESAAQVILGTTVTMFSPANDPVAQIMLKVNDKNGQSRFVVVTTNLVGQTAFQERLMQAHLVKGGDRMSLLDFTNKKNIEADELKSQIQISSMCVNDCEQIVLLVSVLENGQVVAGSHSLLAKVVGKHRLSVVTSSLGKNAQNFEQGVKSAEVALKNKRQLLVAAQAFAKEDFRSQTRSVINKLIVEARDLETAISVARNTVQKSEEAFAQAARASDAASRREELSGWVTTNHLLRVDIHEKELRLIEVQKSIKALEVSLK